MACGVYCSGNDARYIPPEKEAFSPGSLSIYSRFWVAGSPWQLMLSPGYIPGPATDRVPPLPGVYELGITLKTSPNAVVTVYVGKSSNLKARQQQYLRNGDHLSSLVNAILEEDCYIWYRYRVLKSDLQAQRWEARFLLDYDYAWNALLNPPKRIIYLEPLQCCCASVGTSAVAWKTGGTMRHSPVLKREVRSCLNISWNVVMALQIVFCITIICIVALQLVKSTNAGVQCLFGNRDYSGDGLCVYSYVVAGSGIVAAFTLSVLMAVLGNRCFCFWTSASLESVVSASMLVWWAIASTVLTATSHTKNNKSKQSWSVAIVVLSWLITVLWGLSWYLVIFPTFLSRASRPGRQKIGASYPHNVNMQSSAPMAPELSGVSSDGAQTTPGRPTAPPATFFMSSNVDQYSHSGISAMV